MLQWFILQTSIAGGVGSIPGLGTKIPTCLAAQPRNKDFKMIFFS